jgi:hypothetical protein
MNLQAIRSLVKWDTNPDFPAAASVSGIPLFHGATTIAYFDLI